MILYVYLLGFIDDLLKISPTAFYIFISMFTVTMHVKLRLAIIKRINLTFKSWRKISPIKIPHLILRKVVLRKVILRKFNEFILRKI